MISFGVYFGTQAHILAKYGATLRQYVTASLHFTEGGVLCKAGGAGANTGLFPQAPGMER